MSYSIKRYTATGAVQVLDAPPYLDKSHIKVYVAGVLSTSWTWMTSSTISITATAGASIAIQRLTSPESRLVDYLSGVTLTEDSLDQDSLQAFYLSQEARDVYDDLVGYATGPLDSAINAAAQANVSAQNAAASAAQFTTGFNNTIKGLQFSTLGIPTATASYYSAQTITVHAYYGYVANDTINYAGGAPIYGHASFNSNVTFAGSVSSDHHHDFQAYPHYGSTGTLGRMSGFWCQPDITAGTVNEVSQHKASNPLGTGAVGSLYGFYSEELTRGSSVNFSFYGAGQTKGHIGGGLQSGDPATPAFVGYNWTSGHLDLLPRTGYKVFVRGPMLLGSSTEAFAASIDNNATTGQLEITPRSGFNAQVKGKLQVGTGTAAASPIIEATGAGRLEFTAVAGAGATKFNGGDVWIGDVGKGILLVNPAGTITKRVRLSADGLSLVLE